MNAIVTRVLPRVAGVRLSELGFGGAAIGGLYRAVGDAEAADAVSAALSAGIGYFDTAPYYGFGASERRLGAALPRDVVVSSKVGRRLRARGPNEAPPEEGFVGADDRVPEFDYSAAGARASVSASLERLRRETLDLALIHDPGPTTHGDAYPAVLAQVLGEALPALRDLQRDGRVRAIGLGVNETRVCLDVLATAELDVIMLAGRYTLLEQGALGDLLPICAARGIGVVIAGPFNSGLLAGADAPGATYEYDAVPAPVLSRARALYGVATRHEVDVGAAALQFPLAHPAVVSVIPGARSADEVAANAARMRAVIPAAFWAECVRDGLIDPAAPIPA